MAQPNDRVKQNLRADHARADRSSSRGRTIALLVTAALVTMSTVGITGQAATSGTGSVSSTIGSFVEISATDSSIAALAATPSSSDPGPVVRDNSDKFTFSNGFSNTRALFDLDLTSATNSGASSTVTVQGTTHTISDWFFVRQDTNQDFQTVETIGQFDATAASYTAPAGFTKDSQGTFAIKTYDKDAPTDGGDSTLTVHWIYDASANQYYFDATDKDFTNANGEAIVNPSSKLGESSGYAYTVGTNGYGVPSVAGAGSNYVPTVRLAWQVDWSSAASAAKDAYVLVDYPSGVPADTYSFTLTGTATQLTS